MCIWFAGVGLFYSRAHTRNALKKDTTYTADLKEIHITKLCVRNYGGEKRLFKEQLTSDSARLISIHFLSAAGDTRKVGFYGEKRALALISQLFGLMRWKIADHSL